ncbi:MAG: glycerophosphodiester phosphodiesterase [Bacilli bacterium]|nr:glycerophosphodiester phosphodiesterase [Bacilli bacterium]
MYIISHRANDNHSFKENTIEAIKGVLNKDYIDGVEIDIRLTKDNKIVLYHSPIIYNLGLISNNNLKEIKKYANELNDVLKKIKTNKLILIDIKCEICKEDIFIEKLHKIIKKYKKLNIYLCSFNYKLVKKIKEKYKYKTGLIISNMINKNKNIESFDFILMNYRIYHKINKALMLWTINKKEIIDKYKNEEIYIITDKPYLVQKE